MIYLEMGVGFNTPGIIRYPFEQMTFNNENATLIRFNKEHPEGAKENKKKRLHLQKTCTMLYLKL